MSEEYIASIVKVKADDSILHSYHCNNFPVAYPGILFGEGGSTNSVEDRENGNLGAVSP